MGAKGRSVVRYLREPVSVMRLQILRELRSPDPHTLLLIEYGEAFVCRNEFERRVRR